MDGDGADNDVERSMGNDSGDVATDEGRTPGIACPDRIGLSAPNHHQVQVEAGDLETLLGQQHRSVRRASSRNPIRHRFRWQVCRSPATALSRPAGW